MYCQFVRTYNKYIQLDLYTLYIKAHLLVYTRVIFLHSYIQFVLSSSKCIDLTPSFYLHIHKFHLFTCTIYVLHT